MKVLIATQETQGQRDSDFFWTKPGELVTFGLVCGRGKGDIDDGCGCQRCMTGVFTHKGTTTVKVVNSSMTRRELVNALFARLIEAYKLDPTDEAVRKMAEEEAERVVTVARKFRSGDVLEIRGDKFNKRKNKIDKVVDM